MQINNKKDLISFGDKITYSPVTSEKRDNVLEYLSKHKYLEAINIAKQMIKLNIEFIQENTQEIKLEKNNKRKDLNKENEKSKEEIVLNEKLLLNFAKISMDDLHKLTIEKIISTYLYFQEYFSNILLIIHLYIKMNYIDKIYQTFLFLKSEMELNKFSEVNQIIVKFMVQNENNIETKNLKSCLKKIKAVPQQLYDKCQEIYFNSMKILISCSQYSFNLRELSLAERFLFDFVMKISLLLSKDNYILCNTFLLLGNLYTKLGSLKKAHFFYEKILKKSQH